MKVTQIRVVAGRTFSHPYEQFSNLRPEVELVATLDDDENPVNAMRELQLKAEELVEDHKQAMLSDIVRLRHMNDAEQRAHRIASSIREYHQELDEIRKEYPELKQLELGE